MFKNRFDAAEQLVPLLEEHKSKPDTIVIAIPRGGLELGNILAKKLHLPLDVLFSKKIGLPINPEFAIGAVSDKHIFINERFKDIPELKNYIADQVTSIRAVIKERNATYRRDMPPLNLTNKTAIIVDDGVATGNTLLATIALIREYKPKKIVVALPVCPLDTFEKIKQQTDQVVCVNIPAVFYSVGQFYAQFNQVDDQEAIRLLHEANQ